jgi:hypothetical protein
MPAQRRSEDLLAADEKTVTDQHDVADAGMTGGGFRARPQRQPKLAAGEPIRG